MLSAVLVHVAVSAVGKEKIVRLGLWRLWRQLMKRRDRLRVVMVMEALCVWDEVNATSI